MGEPFKVYYASKLSVRDLIDGKSPSTGERQNQFNDENGGTQTLGKGEECQFHYFHFFLKVGAYCGMIPLHLRFNHASKHYQISKMKIFLMIPVSTVSLLPILFGIAQIRNTYQERGEVHAIIFYFGVLKTITWIIILPLVWTGIFHVKIGKMRDMLEVISHSELLRPHTCRLNWIVVISTQLAWVVVSFFYPVFLPESWTLSGAYDNLISTGRYALFINSHWIHIADEALTTTNILVAAFGFVLLVSVVLQNALITSTLGIASFTIWEATSRFIGEAQTSLRPLGRRLTSIYDAEGKSTKHTVAQLHEKFSELTNLANSINATWSALIFWVLLDTTVRNSTDLDYTLQIQNYSYKVYTIYGMVYIAMSVILSAESSRKIRSFRGDIVKPQNALLSTERTYKAAKLLLYQVDDSTICLGQGKFYEVDYALICQVSVIIVTIFVIVIQYNRPDDVPDKNNCNCTLLPPS